MVFFRESFGLSKTLFYIPNVSLSFSSVKVY